MGDLSEHLGRYEVACKCGCGFAAADIQLVHAIEDCLDHFEDRVGQRLYLAVTSGCRCEKHNAAEGGAPGSWHTKGLAMDFAVLGVSADAVADYLESLYPQSMGIGRYKGRTHLDVRDSKARWDKR